MMNSKIKYLSRWLRFSGKNMMGESASFSGALDLENAEGTFDGSVDFSESGVNTIGRLKVLGKYEFISNERQDDSFSAYFFRCMNLTKLCGEYAYPVAAAESNIKILENLKIRSAHSKIKVDLSCNPVKKVGPNVELSPEEILWDEHTDDEAKRIVDKELRKRLLKAQQSQQNQANQENQHTLEIVLPIPKNKKTKDAEKDPTLVEESKRVVIRTIAEAIGADDILVRENQSTSSPKRKKLLRFSTIIMACLGLFLFKTSDELMKQTLIDPVVRTITGSKPTPVLIHDAEAKREQELAPNIATNKPPSLLNKKTNERIDLQAWNNQIREDLDRYAQSQMTHEDRIALARATIQALGLDPKVICLDIDPIKMGVVKMAASAVPALVAKGMAASNIESKIPSALVTQAEEKTKNDQTQEKKRNKKVKEAYPEMQ
jgi:(2Fe-2S) ferredoxin